jgi:hypothetical protein
MVDGLRHDLRLAWRGGAALVLAGVAVLSLFMPVRAAGRVDPATTLRA